MKCVRVDFLFTEEEYALLLKKFGTKAQLRMVLYDSGSEGLNYVVDDAGDHE